MRAAGGLVAAVAAGAAASVKALIDLMGASPQRGDGGGAAACPRATSGDRGRGYLPTPRRPGRGGQAPPDAAGAAAWHELGKLDAFAGRLTRVECEGRTLLVYRADGACTVYDNHCPHQRTPIPLEALEGGALRCPKHGWTFDIATGECTAKGDRPLKRYPSRIDSGLLYAEW